MGMQSSAVKVHETYAVSCTGSVICFYSGQPTQLSQVGDFRENYFLASTRSSYLQNHAVIS